MESPFSAITNSAQSDAYPAPLSEEKGYLYGGLETLFRLFHPLPNPSIFHWSSFSPEFLEVAAYAWIIEGYTHVYHDFSLPEPGSGVFAALSLFFEAVEKKSLHMDIPLRDHRTLQNEVFKENMALPLVKNRHYATEVYYFAKRLLNPVDLNQESDFWTLFIIPSTQIIQAAQHLVTATDVLLMGSKKKNEATFQEHVTIFDSAWKAFLETILHERKKSTSIWIGSSFLNFKVLEMTSSKQIMQALQKKNEDLKGIADKLRALGATTPKMDKALIRHLRYYFCQYQTLTASQVLFKKSLRMLAQGTQETHDLLKECQQNSLILKELVPKMACLMFQVNPREPSTIPDIFSKHLDRLRTIHAIKNAIVLQNPEFTFKKLMGAIMSLSFPTMKFDHPGILSAIKKTRLLEELNDFTQALQEENSLELDQLIKWCVVNFRIITLNVDIHLWLTAEKIIELAHTKI